VDFGETDPVDLWFRGATSRASKCGGNVLDLGEKLWGGGGGFGGLARKTTENLDYRGRELKKYEGTPLHTPTKQRLMWPWPSIRGMGISQ
jgi:hypothetical protein